MSREKDHKTEDQETDATQPAEKPVSLHPLKFEEAVRDLLKAKPPTQDPKVDDQG